MAVKLHRCSQQWVKIKAHPCWKVEKALMDMGVEYERVPGPVSKSKRDAVFEGTGQRLYPNIQFEAAHAQRQASWEQQQCQRSQEELSRAIELLAERRQQQLRAASAAQHLRADHEALCDCAEHPRAWNIPARTAHRQAFGRAPRLPRASQPGL